MSDKYQILIHVEDGKRTLNLNASNMNELVEKIKDWQDWESNKSIFEALNKDKKFMDSEKHCGWYYIQNN